MEKHYIVILIRYECLSNILKIKIYVHNCIQRRNLTESNLVKSCRVEFQVVCGRSKVLYGKINLILEDCASQNYSNTEE